MVNVHAHFWYLFRTKKLELRRVDGVRAIGLGVYPNESFREHYDIDQLNI